VTSIDLQGIDPDEIIQTVRGKAASDDPGERRPRVTATRPSLVDPLDLPSDRLLLLHDGFDSP
jgi:hypothetical protein